MSSPKIGIIGVGVVGGAVYHHFPDAIPYSPHKYAHNKEKIKEADIFFICAPTPYNIEAGGFDLSAVDDGLKLIEGEKVVVIKSTVWPGTTEKYQKLYPQHKFLFNPEFLRAVSAVEDFQNPDRQFVGYTESSKDIAEDILNLLPKAPFSRIIPTTEAEMIKYFGNTFLATKVVFANQMYDICQALALDYDLVRECVAGDARIGPSHLEVMHEGYRGYAGMCFPKDMRAFIQFGEKLGVDLQLLRKAEEINNRLIAANHSMPVEANGGTL